MVLVDGIERELDLVDTEDIASFSILKDAAASAVYGVRGANGVILITTKKGQEGKPRINARAEFGFTNPLQDALLCWVLQSGLNYIMKLRDIVIIHRKKYKNIVTETILIYIRM